MFDIRIHYSFIAFCLGYLIQSSSLYAQDPSKTSDLSSPPSVQTSTDSSHVAILGNYASLDLILPGKTGVTILYASSAKALYELEYLSAQVAVPFLVERLGSFTEKRASLLRRSFMNESSFSGYFGASWNSTELSLGDSTLSTLSGGLYPHVNLLKIDTLGINTGIGNRWIVWKGFLIGVDWLGWSQPIFVLTKETPALETATNEAKKRAIEKTLDTIAYLPRLSILKLQVGWRF
jgi:hypothetical protein